ncbi:hypothetical protein [Qiania dongpingensis]|uniref:NHLM bacteriocin system secretion protein n=1 Tax=Qiania dongpingensis TaxID=2763669 RepID=A0A7G9G3F3_9FIRM|nr:hypothetical protein [Qiania dongpingensis]QNM05335.1 hypothetical protein H9Q78_12995 [Qiania dongpingensis]
MEQNEVFRKTNLERISSPEKLNDYIKVINPSVVIMLAALGLLLAGGLIWGFLGNIPLTVSASGAFYSAEGDETCDRLAVVVPSEDAGSLQTGMEVQVSPSTAGRDSYGFIRGKIAEIETYPVTEEELTELLGSEKLPELIMPDTAGILVTVELETDENTASGLKWSSVKGREVAVRPGTTAAALVVLKNQKPIDLILEN